MGYPGRRKIFEATLRRMVTQALEAEEKRFREAHACDSDEMLLEYLRNCAKILNHTPWPGEIPGGQLLTERFETWERALAAAGLRPPTTANQPVMFSRVREETERQRVIYRQKKLEKKKRAEEQKQARTKQKKQTIL